jgi:hypothetical protein
LIGEINGGDDYAFAMNTFEQIGALVPLVRYDSRFARAIGKWVLNAANASRLFYPNFLPDALNSMRAATGLVFVLAPAEGELRVEAEKMWPAPRNSACRRSLRLPHGSGARRFQRRPHRRAEDPRCPAGAIAIPIGAAESFRGVIDLVPSSITNEKFNGSRVSWKRRLEVAAEKGIPQVIAPAGVNTISRVAASMTLITV